MPPMMADPYADARIGELTRELPKAPVGKRRGSEFRSGTQKKDALADEGLSRKRAAECEKVTALAKSGDLRTMIPPPTLAALRPLSIPPNPIPHEERPTARPRVFLDGTQVDERKAA